MAFAPAVTSSFLPVLYALIIVVARLRCASFRSFCSGVDPAAVSLAAICARAYRVCCCSAVSSSSGLNPASFFSSLAAAPLGFFCASSLSFWIFSGVIVASFDIFAAATRPSCISGAYFCSTSSSDMTLNTRFNDSVRVIVLSDAMLFNSSPTRCENVDSVPIAAAPKRSAFRSVIFWRASASVMAALLRICF